MELILKNNLFARKCLITFYLMLGFAILFSSSCSHQDKQIDDQFAYAKARSNDLKLSIYITAHAVNSLLVDEVGRREALSIFRCNGITKAYIEVYRGGLVIEQALLEEVKAFFLKNDIEVVGGIATVPGADFGIKQEGPLGWFNWQHPKTQKDLKEVMRMAASVFDEFIVDDFLCTSDTSIISKEAKGEMSWSQYRMNLLTGLSEEIFIKPAKEVNPDITMIIKFPQWYDRFHLFGYDIERGSSLYDKVWVGTESRGQYTQRFGFVQPYEGFVNYRWISDIAGAKMAGAWFDHGDCDKNDFIEQAWQTVLAGAKEIVFFNYFDFVNGHPSHHLVRTQFHQLADLAKYVNNNPVEGIAAYKPQYSDAGGDLYFMDIVGMLGIPLVPHFQYPENAKVILLPTQAAKDHDILKKIEKSLAKGTTIIFTSGFIANANNAEKIAELAGIEYPVVVNPVKANKIYNNGKYEKITNGLDLETIPVLINSKALLNAELDSKLIPFFIKSEHESGTIFTINSHTFSQADFDAVGEVLLCPKSLGLLEIPTDWANTIRNAIVSPLNFELLASTRIVVQPIGDSAWMFHNYNQNKEDLIFIKSNLSKTKLLNGFTGDTILTHGDTLKLSLQARSRIWIKELKN